MSQTFKKFGTDIKNTKVSKTKMKDDAKEGEEKPNEPENDEEVIAASTIK
jgi:hypothetical protein